MDFVNSRAGTLFEGGVMYWYQYLVFKSPYEMENYFLIGNICQEVTPKRLSYSLQWLKIRGLGLCFGIVTQK